MHCRRMGSLSPRTQDATNVEVFILLNAILTCWLDIKDTAGMQGKFSVMRLDGLEAQFEKNVYENGA